MLQQEPQEWRLDREGILKGGYGNGEDYEQSAVDAFHQEGRPHGQGLRLGRQSHTPISECTDEGNRDSGRVQGLRQLHTRIAVLPDQLGRRAETDHGSMGALRTGTEGHGQDQEVGEDNRDPEGRSGYVRRSGRGNLKHMPSRAANPGRKDLSMTECEQYAFVRRYQIAINRIGGTFALLNLTEREKAVLRDCTDLVEKTKMLEAIADRIEGVKR